MVGCRSCGESVQAEAQAKQDRGEELTEDEQRVLDAEDPNEVLPKKFGIPVYGRLSSYDGQFCPFCEKVGFLLAIGLTAVLANFVFQSEFTGNTFWIATLLIGAAQLGMVLYTGRYLIVGAIAGPIVERVFAAGGIYLTEKAKQEYKTENSQPELVDENDLPEGSQVDVGDDGSVDVHLPGDPTDREEELARKYEQQKQLTRKERAKKSEFKAEVQEKDKELNQVQQKIQKKDKKIQETEKEVAEIETIAETLFGSSGLLNGNITPCMGFDENDNPVIKGLVVTTVWHEVNLDHYSGRYPNALIVDTLDEARDFQSFKGKVDIGQKIEGMELYNRIAKYGRWAINIEKVDNPPKYMSPEHPDYPQTSSKSPIQDRGEYPEVLFWNGESGVNQAQQEPDFHSERGKKPVRILAYNDPNHKKDEGQQTQNYKPPGFDPRGSERVSELDDENRKLDRLLRTRRSQLKKLSKDYRDLNHEKEILEDKLQHQEDLTNRTRKDEREAQKRSQLLTEEVQNTKRGLDRLDSELDEVEDLYEEADEKRKQHRRDRIDESDSFHEEVESAKSQRSRVEKVTDAFETIRATGYTGNGKDIDLAAVADGESEYSREDVVRIFLEDDDVGDQLNRVQKNITGNLTDGAASGGVST